MDHATKPEPNTSIGKKELKKQMADKLAAAIPELKLTLGEKKFEHRIKKAVKLITEGLHKKEAKQVIKKAAPKVKTATSKQAVAKKTKAPNKAKA